jgi:acyl carrier protein
MKGMRKLGYLDCAAFSLRGAPCASLPSLPATEDIVMTATTQQQVFEIIASQAKVDLATIRPESTLKDLGVASLEAIEMIFDIEEHFDITFPDQQGANFDTDTAQSLADAVQKALDDKAAAGEGSK